MNSNNETAVNTELAEIKKQAELENVLHKNANNIFTVKLLTGISAIFELANTPVFYKIISPLI